MNAETETGFKRRMQPIIAWRAMKKLIADKEQTEEVFVILRRHLEARLLLDRREHDVVEHHLQAVPRTGRR